MISHENSPVVQLKPNPLDRVFGAVLAPKTISLVHGPEQAPLTMLAHSVIVAGARMGGGAYLDSGDHYKPNIVRAMCLRGEEPESILKSIRYRNHIEMKYMDEFVEQLGMMHDVKVVIIDSLNRLLNRRGELVSKQRQRDLFHLLHILRLMANRTGMHIMMTDHSVLPWQTVITEETREEDLERMPIGGNVLSHGIDTVVRMIRLTDKKTGVKLKDHFRVLVERTPVVSLPRSVVVRMNMDRILSIRG
jgi:hypothetical protein